MSYKKVLLLFFVHCVLCFAQAQLVTVPYQFGFEKGDPEINNWKLNFGSRGEYCEASNENNSPFLIFKFSWSTATKSLYFLVRLIAFIASITILQICRFTNEV